MLTRVSVDSYRGFNLSIDLRKMTVLIGPNSCGKTSILRVIHIVCAALLEEASRVSITDAYHGIFNVMRPMVFQPVPPRWETELSRSIDGPASLELDFEESDLIQSCRLGLDQDGDIFLNFKSARARELLERQGESRRNEALRDLLRDQLPLAVLIPAFYGVIQREEYRTTAVVDRLLESSDQSRIIRNLVTRLDPQGFERLNRFLQLTVGAQIVRCTSGAEIDRTETLQVFFRDQNCEEELASAGTGLVSLIAMFAALWRFRLMQTSGRPVILLLDEPEAHLHPRLQGQLGVQLAELSAETGSQLVVATHSVEMINRLAQRNETILISLDMQTNRATVLTSEMDTLNELGNFCDLSPFASLHLLKTRRILFHEGQTDASILNSCAETYLYHDSIRLSRYRSWTLASLTGVDNAGAADLLKRALAPLFPVLKDGESVRVVRVLDRDYRAEPKFGPIHTEGAFESLDVTWSRHSIESLFLEPECLAEWIYPTLIAPNSKEPAPDKQQLIQYITEAITAANQDGNLTRQTQARLTIAGLGNSRSDRDVHRAAEQAYDEARRHPEIWQGGRDRAKYVLSHVRSRLASCLQNRIRSDLTQVITRGAWAGHSTPGQRLIPEEIRRLLDHMTQN